MAAKTKVKTIPPKTKKRPAPKNPIPSKRQLDALEQFEQLKKERGGKPPTFAQVSAALKLSRAGSVNLLESLEAKRCLARQPVTIEGPLDITPEGKRWLKTLRQNLDS